MFAQMIQSELVWVRVYFVFPFSSNFMLLFQMCPEQVEYTAGMIMFPNIIFLIEVYLLQRTNAMRRCSTISIVMGRSTPKIRTLKMALPKLHLVYFSFHMCEIIPNLQPQ